MVLNEGDSAPSFNACTNKFATITDKDFGSKKVVLSFFPAAFSGSPSDGCEMQLCGMSHLSEQTSAEDVIFYGISGDLPFANAEFAKKHSLKYELLSDPTLKTCEQYVGLCSLGDFLAEHGLGEGLKGVKTSARGCVVLQNGKVLYAFSGGDHPGLQPDLQKVKKVLGIS